jgi:sugar phosphate isomerase/epimerase
VLLDGQDDVAVKFSLSTNWCNARLARGEEIAELAGEMGFSALELGFRTTPEQAAGFRARLDVMPVGSVHAYCPVPLSAPYGHPELYTFASRDAGARSLARVHLVRTIRFAADMGADAVVLHAGRVGLSGLFRTLDSARLREILKANGDDVTAKPYAAALARAQRRRRSRGAKLLEAFTAELSPLVPVLESAGVTLAFENLPYLEGFPDERETAALLDRFAGAPVKAWFDTGHDRVRRCHGWCGAQSPLADRPAAFAGCHLNDVRDFSDDHLPPGEGKVDFAVLKPLAETVAHRVFEPSSDVTREAIEASLAYLRRLWTPHGREAELPAPTAARSKV